MITEDYCSFEVAKLLKEKGFNEQCRAAYTNYGKLFTTQIQQYITNILCSKGTLWDCTAPTLQMAMKWLREKYGIFIAINNDDLDFNWQCYDLINRGSTLDPKILSESYAGYKTYEEAVEAAFKFALENLI